MKAADVKKTQVIAHEGAIYQIRDIERSAPTARGGNVNFRLTLYSIPGNRKLDLSLRADDQVQEIELSRRQASFSYRDGDTFVFMDREDYTQYLLAPELVGEQAGYVSEAVDDYYVQLIDEQPVGLQVPTSVLLTVADTAPGLRGASATKRSKPARLHTGLEIQVPEYISSGEQVWVNTVSGEFAGRV